jgi:hypothetical protein
MGEKPASTAPHPVGQTEIVEGYNEDGTPSAKQTIRDENGTLWEAFIGPDRQWHYIRISR